MTPEQQLYMIHELFCFQILSEMANLMFKKETRFIQVSVLQVLFIEQIFLQYVSDVIQDHKIFL